MNKLNWKEKLIANNNVYLTFCYLTPTLLILSWIGIAIFMPWDFYTDQIIWILFDISWFIFIFDIFLIIIGTVIENKRMKVVVEYKHKNMDNDKIKAIETAYNSYFYSSKRKRELTCYVFSELYPDINTKKESNISSRL